MFDGWMPVVFGSYFKHTEILSHLKATSAGFFYEKNGEVTVYGESLSLGLKALPGDAFFIQKMLEGN